ncbi:MAG TPA: 7TM diverse intracellular signaling domain-containing protein [Oligoflexus sp.]|uniref:7TM diverse intracellular signaling domain-containing protein n=1 Tax=Oligoflexus sp. TaxID=1971216 RepID=UPI002D4CD608|nr:7TM diverse intracellular signaling domain-containing protein [Oligoflexus sp.]HYX32963.1 7TM diverse intracellular signaling domain-containing protein [Oligoflexus sp.]
MFKIILTFIVLIAFHQETHAQSHLTISDNFGEMTLFPFDILTDSDGHLNFRSLPKDSAAWKPAASPTLNLGYTSASYWFRFTLSKRTTSLQRLFLVVSYPLHDRIEVHRPNQQGAYQEVVTGDNFPFFERPIKVTRFVFDLDLDEVNGQPVYINIRSGSSMRIDMRLSTTERLLERNQLETAAFFLFYGTMSAMILYNLLLYISIRERTYIYYVLYILSHTLFQMGLNGHLLQFVMPDFPNLASAMIPILVGTTSIGVSLFTQSFLESRTFTPRLHRALQLCVLLGCLLIALSAFLPYSRIIPLANILPFYFSIVCFISGMIRYRQGYRPASIYCLAFFAFFMGVILASALTFGFVPNTMITEYGAQMGSTLEVIMLSIALASKINGERKSRYEAQKNALALALEKQHSYEQMERLLYPHQLDMIQKGLPIETTMPAGLDIACVLSFDVMDSSKVKSEGFSEIMEEFLADCRELMMRGYDGNTLTSAGYMIKEMGDGFLCSVGFPLKQLGSSKAECAVELARQIIDRFTRLNEKLDAPSPVYCCIGVAMGQVKTYFSKSGSVKYDMWGRGIILATRYESLRKEILQKLPLEPGNMLILQEDVYYSLPAHVRAQFQVHSLDGLGLQVRDHPEATTLVFLQIPAVTTFLEAS